MDDSKPSLNEGMFENFRNFVLKSIKQEVELAKDASIQNLLLPNWCRIHSTFHSEISCTMCKEAIAQVSKMVPQAWIAENVVKVNSSCMKILDPEQERISEGEIRQEEHHKESKDLKVKSPIEYENNQV